MCWGLVTCTGEREFRGLLALKPTMIKCVRVPVPAQSPRPEPGPQVDINLRCYAEVVKHLHLNRTDPTY